MATYNYTIKYKTFDSLLEDVNVDFRQYALDNMIDPQTLIKVAKRVTYDLGLRIYMTKETVLEVTNHKVKLPDDFFSINYALICADLTTKEFLPQGTHIEEVKVVPTYTEVPGTIDQCAPPTVNCANCGCTPCGCNPAMCMPGDNGVVYTQTNVYDPNNPYGNVCVRPRTFVNQKGEQYEIVQMLKTQTRHYKSVHPIRLRESQDIECGCPNLYWKSPHEGWIRDGFLYVNFEHGNVYLNYQGSLEDEDGNLLVPDHEYLNEYYEYALKQRILENLLMNGEDVTAKMQLIEARYRAARNVALGFINTPNFAEMKQLWETNRRAMYSKYYDMFKSYPRNDIAYPYKRSYTM